MENKNASKEFQELVLKFLDDPKEMYLICLTKEQIKNMAILTTIMNIERNKFRNKLIEIRLQMNIPRSTMIQQTKRLLTNLIKELK